MGVSDLGCRLRLSTPVRPNLGVSGGPSPKVRPKALRSWEEEMDLHKVNSPSNISLLERSSSRMLGCGPT